MTKKVKVDISTDDNGDVDAVNVLMSILGGG
jgi:hypothetical protein